MDHKKSREDRLRIWIDGACEPVNPGGTASYGVVVKHGEEVLFVKGGIVGEGRKMSNNVGEYSGLIAFLEWYLETQASLASRDLKRRPVIYSDSKMLIYQMTGEWRAKGGLYIPFYDRAQTLIRENNLDLSFWKVPRSENEEADRLSKEALLDVGVKLRIQPEDSV